MSKNPPRRLAAPRPHQIEARAAIRATLANHDRALAVMACGSGKSLVSMWCAEDIVAAQPPRAGGHTGLVLVPSLALLRQMLGTWQTHSSWGRQLRTMCVCSDPAVADGLERDDLAADSVEFPVVTDPLVVRDFLAARSAAGPDAVSIVFSTYHSAPVIGQALQGLEPSGEPFRFEFSVADEAHKTVGKDNRFSYALHDENIPAARRLFFTATPRHYVEGRKGEGLDVVSMDDETLYGPRAYTLSFREAAQRGIIVPYKVIISVVDSTRIDPQAIAQAQAVAGGRVVDATDVAHQIALAQAIKAHDLRRVITFHSRIDDARSFVDAERLGETLAPQLPGFELLHINGSMRAGERQAVMSRFESAGRALITNARCLTEGVDVPSVDMSAFIDPKKSRVDVAQAAGRAMRPAPGKDTGYVFVPLLLSPKDGESLEDAARRTGFTDVLAVLTAMREVDEVLGDAIRDSLRTDGKPVAAGAPIDDEVEIIAPPGDLLSVQALRDVIRTRVVMEASSGWERGMAACRAFHAANGHLRVARAFVTADGLRLGVWIHNRRADRKAGGLSEQRVAELDSLGMVWDPLADDWRDGIEACRAFHAANGHLRVPRAFVTADGFRLGIWIANRRKYRKAGRLPADRIAELDALGMVWEAFADDWRDGIEACRAFRVANGHLRVAHSFVTPDGFRLGTWIAKRRQDLKAGTLSAERIAELDALGMVWDALADDWRAGIEACRAFRAANGHLRVPKGFVTPDGFRLGAWIANRRRDLKAGRLAAERIAELDALSMVWEVKPTPKPTRPRPRG